MIRTQSNSWDSSRERASVNIELFLFRVKYFRIKVEVRKKNLAPSGSDVFECAFDTKFID